MAPDRGSSKYQAVPSEDSDGQHASMDETEELNRHEETAVTQEARQRSQEGKFLADQAEQDTNFTLRSTLVGLIIGVIICFSNTYFGLQTGWVSGMAMPSALIGFAYFKSVARYINYPFTPVENVLVTTVAGAVGTMPLGCGFVGVMPALNFLLKTEENGPLVLGTGKLIIWAIGICFFGVVFAVPLRREVIIREKLKFPSGTATALVIGVLHGNRDGDGPAKNQDCLDIFKQRSQDALRSSSISGIPPGSSGDDAVPTTLQEDAEPDQHRLGIDHRSDWKAKIKLLLIAFAISAVYTLVQYFIPHLRSLPVFGLPLATNWLWALNPSPAYVGQGIIMGPATTFHMLLGAIVGWGILSPLAKSKGWAPGPVSDWESGSKGWIVWVSLSIMLADSVISLGWLILHPILLHAPRYFADFKGHVKRGSWSGLAHFGKAKKDGYTPLSHSASSAPLDSRDSATSEPEEDYCQGSKEVPEVDAPASHLVSNRLVVILAVLSVVVCILSIRVVFGALIPFHAILLAILFALLLSVMGVRALGETDLNPVSGISKITQLFFALVIPASNPNVVTINLLAGAVSESGALQAGDMMQDLKTGHLLGASPKAQFYGQMIGSFVGAIISAWVYQLYTRVYEVPGGIFQVPTAYVWISTARLVTGQGLPPVASQWALGAAIIFAGATGLRIMGQGKWWQAWVPGGIAVAVGMYNEPSFTLARTIGGIVSWYWRIYRGQEETPVIVLASGLILGEGMVSILNLVLASLEVPHL